MEYGAPFIMAPTESLSSMAVSSRSAPAGPANVPGGLARQGGRRVPDLAHPQNHAFGQAGPAPQSPAARPG
ncbi:hypothetical protein EASAB2608_08210 [Streptomyces sp. EAS-AB2608]|nr:hypothetical protein EASAB2608_08210 [Streptomyces sp. EAS-AB2608]